MVNGCHSASIEELISLRYWGNKCAPILDSGELRWKLVEDEQKDLMNLFSFFFFFSACESFNETRMQNAPLEVRESTVENIIPYEYSSIHSLATDDEPRCTALYLRCITTIHTVPLTFRVKGNIIDDSEDTFLWPWHAAIFVDGRYRCSAVLLEPNWLLTSFYCTENVM